MQVSCNKEINTTVFPWFFFLLRSSGKLERQRCSKLNTVYQQNGLSARRSQLQVPGALPPVQNRELNKPHAVMQWLQASDSRGWESTQSPKVEPCGTRTTNFRYAGPSSGSPDKLWMSLIVLLPEGILEDFQVLQPPEKFVCIFSCMQTGKAVIQQYTHSCNYGTTLWFPILQAGTVLKDQTPAWGHIEDFCSHRSCSPEMGGKENATCTLCP